MIVSRLILDALFSLGEKELGSLARKNTNEKVTLSIIHRENQILLVAIIFIDSCY